ncbi:MAG: hypothetical protein JSS97_03245 [Actinobacteria bacterium]|nr:hypothetical protein [Actinomycetota bacterium]
MFATLLSAAVTCLASLFIGQAVLRLAGAREWNWIAPPVGLSALMLLATPTMSIPGKATTMAVFVGLLTIAAMVWCLGSALHRPPLGGLLAAVPVGFLVLLPFLAVGRSGILGVSLDNDMAAHMQFSEIYLSDAVANLKPMFYNLYPFGPQAISAVLARGLNVRVDHSFAGLTMAIPLLNAWTVLALVRGRSWLKQAIAATVVSMPFLVAAYYGQGSFKELIQTGLVLATVVTFAGDGPRLGRGRWVPLALLVGGMISVYSLTGVSWPVVIGGLWVLVIAVQRLYRDGTQGIVAEVRGQLPAVGIGLAVLILVLLPQASRIHNFISLNANANGIIVPKDVLANLVAPLPGWEGFGVWSNPDYRLPASPEFIAGMWTAFVFALVLFGAWWLCKRGRWMLPLAAAGSMLIWRVSMNSQSPYVVAKALVIASPLLLIVAVLPLLEQFPDRLSWLWPKRGGGRDWLRSLVASVPGQPFSWALAATLAAVLFVVIGVSDVRALRASPVGPTYQASELRELSPLVDYKPTLFLGDDDFIKWELPGVPVGAPVFGGEESMIRAEKGWTRGEPLDFDTVDAATLNSYDYVITTRDAAGSQPPPQMHLVRQTPDFQLWRRVGKVQERSVLPEGEGSGAVLDCTSAEGRKILAGGGVAAVRPAPVVVEGHLLGPGGSETIELPLVRGEWIIESSYNSRLPVTVTGPGLDVTLEPNLDRPGPRFPVGELVVRKPEKVKLTFTVSDPFFARAQVVTDLGKVTATPRYPEKVVPIAQACGKYVDWYRGAGSPR